jgi:hypothetical protein
MNGCSYQGNNTYQCSGNIGNGTGVVVFETTKWASDSVYLGETAILLGIAICLVTAARIAWVNQAKLFGPRGRR